MSLSANAQIKILPRVQTKHSYILFSRQPPIDWNQSLSLDLNAEWYKRTTRKERKVCTVAKAVLLWYFTAAEARRRYDASLQSSEKIGRTQPIWTQFHSEGVGLQQALKISWLKKTWTSTQPLRREGMWLQWMWQPELHKGPSSELWCNVKQPPTVPGSLTINNQPPA